MLVEVIKKTTTEQKETREINLPYYCKDASYIYGIESPDKIICVTHSGVNTWSHIRIEDVAGTTPITEAEFIAAYVIAREKTSFNLESINLNNGTDTY